MLRLGPPPRKAGEGVCMHGHDEPGKHHGATVIIQNAGPYSPSSI